MNLILIFFNHTSVVLISALGQQRSMIASVCPIVGQCADHGDAAAIDIIKKAAFHLARLLRTAVSRCGQLDIPVTVSGGAWKATSLFFSSFKEKLLKELPALEVRAPLSSFIML